jgi:hypothetical protein
VRAFVAVTDKDWYQFLAARPNLDEVNFWQPGGNRLFQALSSGDRSSSSFTIRTTPSLGEGSSLTPR